MYKPAPRKQFPKKLCLFVHVNRVGDQDETSCLLLGWLDVLPVVSNVRERISLNADADEVYSVPTDMSNDDNDLSFV